MSQEQVYNEYMNYDWESFEDFQTGLKEILDNFLQNLKEQDPSITSVPAHQKQQLIDQAKSFFYCSHTGNILNLDDYEAWKRKNFSNIVELDDQDPSDEPPYSSNYQELVELIMSGKPVPGIKQIPDTVLTEQSSVSTASQRPKPWEK